MHIDTKRKTWADEKQRLPADEELRNQGENEKTKAGLEQKQVPANQNAATTQAFIHPQSTSVM